MIRRLDEESRRGEAPLTGDVVVVETRRTLPSPRLGHREIVREIATALDGQRLAITGNYFDGLAIEDCVQRSFGEWARVGRGFGPPRPTTHQTSRPEGAAAP